MVRELIPPEVAVADIGSGHGLLAAALAAEGRRVIATERTPATVAELRRCLGHASEPIPVHAPAAGIAVEIRRGEGLAPIAPGEVEVAVVAGLGGRNLVRLLERSPWLPPALALQPQADVEAVAAWIAGRAAGSRRVEVAERGRTYTAFLVHLREG
jgi:tRNA (adenine22-N1)-methyltransferase